MSVPGYTRPGTDGEIGGEERNKDRRKTETSYSTEFRKRKTVRK